MINKEYVITINLESEQSFPYSKFEGDIHINNDKYILYDKKISLISIRSKTHKLDNILKNKNNSIHKSIVNVLFLYVLLIGCPVTIKRMKIESKYNNKEKKFEKGSFNKFLNNYNDNYKLLSYLDKDVLKNIFSGNAKNYKEKIISLTFLLKSIDSDNNTYIFEKAWKAYNSLYKLASGKNKDFDCLKFISDDMSNNPSSYPLSISYFDKQSKDDIRNNIKYNKFIQDFSLSKNMDGFRTFALSRKDFRILEIISDSITVVKKYTSNVVEFNDLKDKIARIKETKYKDNSCAAKTICNKYGYFVRNKIFHGEIKDNDLEIIKTEDEYTNPFLNSALIRLCIDIVNNLVK